MIDAASTDASSEDVARHTPAGVRHGVRRNLPIQWLRALAALMVMLYHNSALQQSLLHDGRLRAVMPDALGYFGVALFFAISGYLMSVAIRVQSPFVFLAHRIVRIYPLYFVVAACACLITILQGETLIFDWRSLLLMPLARVDYNLKLVEWTLVYEIAFYVMLFLVSLAGQAKRIVPLAALWLLVISGYSIVAPDDGTRLILPIYRLLLVCTCAPMAAGLLLPSFAMRFGSSWLLLPLAAIPWVVAALMPVEIGQNYEALRWVYSASAVLCLWAMLKLSENPRADGGRLGRIFANYGDSSYALYLCHVPVISLVYASLPGLRHGEAWGLSVASTILASLALGRLDVSLYERLKIRLKQARPIRVHALAALYAVVFLAAAAKGGYDYYWIDRMTALARHDAALMLQHPIATPEDAAAAAMAAGLHPDDQLAGRVDTIKRVDPGGRLYLDAWGLDRSAKTHVVILFFRDGALLAIALPEDDRADIDKAYGVKRNTAVHLDRAEPCNASPIIAVLLTSTDGFAVLDSQPSSIQCPE
jgi:peptidoglycan/LPS O-acetylase OafA/YrhL